MHIGVNPQREEGDPVFLIAGNDESTKKSVAQIAKGWGWKDIVDLGNISESFYMESFAFVVDP
jgi:8-hydroxy-5-deazaflavin:NADPH oxidoreductase